MQILSQVVSALYSLFSPMPLLTAPRQPDCLPASFSGTIPRQPAYEVIFDKLPSRADFIAALGPIRSREEMQSDHLLPGGLSSIRAVTNAAGAPRLTLIATVHIAIQLGNCPAI